MNRKNRRCGGEERGGVGGARRRGRRSNCGKDVKYINIYFFKTSSTKEQGLKLYQTSWKTGTKVFNILKEKHTNKEFCIETIF